VISLSRVSKQYGRQVLFVDASFQLNPGEKVGLVGPNGAGKTTLFRMIVGEEAPDEGDVSVPKKNTIGYFPPAEIHPRRVTLQMIVLPYIEQSALQGLATLNPGANKNLNGDEPRTNRHLFH